jgi:hypothetical protein
MRSFRRVVLGLLATLAVAGCVSVSNATIQSEENMLLTHQGGALNTRLSILRSEARWYAYLYSQKQRKNARVIAFEDAIGPFFIGNFPKTDIIFSCTGS